MCIVVHHHELECFMAVLMVTVTVSVEIFRGYLPNVSRNGGYLAATSDKPCYYCDLCSCCFCVSCCLLYLENVFSTFLSVLFVCKSNFVSVCVCICLSLASDSSETVKVIIIEFGTVTASDMIIHHVNYIDLGLHSRSHRYNILNIWYFRKCSSNAHHICCENSPTKGLYNLFLVWWPWPLLKVTIAS